MMTSKVEIILQNTPFPGADQQIGGHHVIESMVDVQGKNWAVYLRGKLSQAQVKSALSSMTNTHFALPVQDEFSLISFKPKGMTHARTNPPGDVTVVRGHMYYARPNPISKTDFHQEMDEMLIDNPEKHFTKYTVKNTDQLHQRLWKGVSYAGESYGWKKGDELWHRRASFIMPKIKINKALKGATMFYHTHPSKDEPSLTSADDIQFYLDLHFAWGIKSFYTVMKHKLDHFTITSKPGGAEKYLRMEEDAFIDTVDGMIGKGEEVAKKEVGEDRPEVEFQNRITKEMVDLFNKKFKSIAKISFRPKAKNPASKLARKSSNNPIAALVNPAPNPPIKVKDQYVAKALDELKGLDYAHEHYGADEYGHTMYVYWWLKHHLAPTPKQPKGRLYKLNEYGLDSDTRKKLRNYLSQSIIGNYNYMDAVYLLALYHDIAKLREKGVKEPGWEIGAEMFRKEIGPELNLPEKLTEDLAFLFDTDLGRKGITDEDFLTQSGDYYGASKLVQMADMITHHPTMYTKKGGEAYKQEAMVNMVNQLRVFLDHHHIIQNPPPQVNTLQWVASYDIDLAYEEAEELLGEFHQSVIPDNDGKTKQADDQSSGGHIYYMRFNNTVIPGLTRTFKANLALSTGKLTVYIGSPTPDDLGKKAANDIYQLVGSRLKESYPEIDIEEIEPETIVNPRHANKIQIISISGPSGGGKSTVLHYLHKHIPNSSIPPTYTTRPRRRSDGADRKFVSRTQFNAMLKRGEFVEWDTSGKHFYGRRFKDFLGNVAIIEVSLQGKKHYEKRFANVFSIYLDPDPSLTEEERAKAIFRRGGVTKEGAKQRAKKATETVKRSKKMQFDLRVTMMKGKYHEGAKKVLSEVPLVNDSHEGGFIPLSDLIGITREEQEEADRRLAEEKARIRQEEEEEAERRRKEIEEYERRFKQTSLPIDEEDAYRDLHDDTPWANPKDLFDWFEDWAKLINMKNKELKAFLDSDWGKVAGLSPEEAKKLGINSGRTSGRRILKMRKKLGLGGPKDYIKGPRHLEEMWEVALKKWTGPASKKGTDWYWCTRQVRFNKRFMGDNFGERKGPLVKKQKTQNQPSRRLLSLWVWGHDPWRYARKNGIERMPKCPDVPWVGRTEKIKYGKIEVIPGPRKNPSKVTVESITHRQVPVTLRRKTFQVDELMAPLLIHLWDNGVQTLFSCQGESFDDPVGDLNPYIEKRFKETGEVQEPTPGWTNGYILMSDGYDYVAHRLRHLLWNEGGTGEISTFETHAAYKNGAEVWLESDYHQWGKMEYPSESLSVHWRGRPDYENLRHIYDAFGLKFPEVKKNPGSIEVSHYEDPVQEEGYPGIMQRIDLHENGENIGYLIWWNDSKDKVWIHHLRVLPEHRKKGLGLLLIDELRKRPEAKGKKIHLHAPLRGGPRDWTVKWYERLGFKPIDEDSNEMVLQNPPSRSDQFTKQDIIWTGNLEEGLSANLLKAIKKLRHQNREYFGYANYDTLWSHTNFEPTSTGMFEDYEDKKKFIKDNGIIFSFHTHPIRYLESVLGRNKWSRWSDVPSPADYAYALNQRMVYGIQCEIISTQHGFFIIEVIPKKGSSSKYTQKMFEHDVTVAGEVWDYENVWDKYGRVLTPGQHAKDTVKEVNKRTKGANFKVTFYDDPIIAVKWKPHKENKDWVSFDKPIRVNPHYTPPPNVAMFPGEMPQGPAALYQQTISISQLNPPKPITVMLNRIDVGLPYSEEDEAGEFIALNFHPDYIPALHEAAGVKMAKESEALPGSEIGYFNDGIFINIENVGKIPIDWKLARLVEALNNKHGIRTMGSDQGGFDRHTKFQGGEWTYHPVFYGFISCDKDSMEKLVELFGDIPGFEVGPDEYFPNLGKTMKFSNPPRSKPFPWNKERVKLSPLKTMKRAKATYKAWKEGKPIGFSATTSLKSMGKIPRASGKYKLGDKYVRINSPKKLDLGAIQQTYDSSLADIEKYLAERQEILDLLVEETDEAIRNGYMAMVEEYDKLIASATDIMQRMEYLATQIAPSDSSYRVNPNHCPIEAEARRAATDPSFKHHEWYIEHHLDYVMAIAKAIVKSDEEEDQQLIHDMVWMHDYPKMMGDKDNYELVRELVSKHRSERYTDRLMNQLRWMEAIKSPDWNGRATTIAAVMSTADALAHYYGPFFQIFHDENPDTPIAELKKKNRAKLEKDKRKLRAGPRRTALDNVKLKYKGRKVKVVGNEHIAELIERKNPVRDPTPYTMTVRHEIGTREGPYGHVIEDGKLEDLRLAEIITVDTVREPDTNKFLLTLYEDWKKAAEELGEAPDPIRNGGAFAALIKLVNNTRYSPKNEMFDKALDVKEEMVGQTWTLDKIDEYGGICRHQALVNAWILERALKEGRLSGKVFYEKGYGHAWAVYRLSSWEEWMNKPDSELTLEEIKKKGKSEVIIDSAQDMWDYRYDANKVGYQSEDGKYYIYEQAVKEVGPDGKPTGRIHVREVRSNPRTKKGRKFPSKYLKGLTPTEKAIARYEIDRGYEYDMDDPAAYKDWRSDIKAKARGLKTVPSKWRNKFAKKYGPLKKGYDFLDRMAKTTGVKRKYLKKIQDKGLAAWRVGHRPGVTPMQWARGRVYAFVMAAPSSTGPGKPDHKLAVEAGVR